MNRIVEDLEEKYRTLVHAKYIGHRKKYYVGYDESILTISPKATFEEVREKEYRMSFIQKQEL
jgi:hypothetical protein